VYLAPKAAVLEKRRQGVRQSPPWTPPSVCVWARRGRPRRPIVLPIFRCWAGRRGRPPPACCSWATLVHRFL